MDADNQPATAIRSADFVASEAPMANSAPGVAAAPRMITNSITGPGSGNPARDTARPAQIDTIIGFFSSPSPTVRRMPSDMRPSRDPVIRITIRDPNTIRSIASTSITGPMASGPNSITSIGIPRNPTLPIAAHCASTEASAAPSPRRNAIAEAVRYTTPVPQRYAHTKCQENTDPSDSVAENRNSIADRAK